MGRAFPKFQKVSINLNISSSRQIRLYYVYEGYSSKTIVFLSTFLNHSSNKSRTRLMEAKSFKISQRLWLE